MTNQPIEGTSLNLGDNAQASVPAVPESANSLVEALGQLGQQNPVGVGETPHVAPPGQAIYDGLEGIR